MKAVPLFIYLTCVSAVCYGRHTECVTYTRKSNHSMSGMFLAPKSDSNIKEQVKFHLFTRNNPYCTQEIKINDLDSLRYSNFNLLWPVRFVIHGWKNDLSSEIIDLIKSAYLYRGYFNVIIVDWGDVAYNLNYHHVATLVNSVGIIVSEFIRFLHSSALVSYNNIYLIGHSLGAHVAGSAGHHSPVKISTIFALDPAEPYFKDMPLEQRIDPSDAQYVEAIHTDISFLGFQDPVGHADFYPNYGKKQKGCEFTLKTCSHSRAYQYFAESINSVDGFWATPCKDINEIFMKKCTPVGQSVLMGGEPAVRKNGVFYLPTNKKPSFSKGKIVAF